ncbi:MBL fold metallo-hydrolase [Allofournierella sp.]|uniref:MBL fold metallo-hydrolase n=1 Tax=Allofournierella sp. TaxID=1940256 RepID=UPI003AB64572
MKVTHLYHSGFLVELKHTLLLFDWYKGQLPPLDAQKPLYVFVSHVHPDHYDPAIWKLYKEHPAVRYILHKKVPIHHGAELLRVGSRETHSLEGLSIQTLRSTDTGCAFVVEAEGLRFYHAGDLNWWHWEGESQASNAWQDKAFHEELARIAGVRFDCAFLPLDPRQEAAAPWGFVDFLKACPTAHAFPMHYWGDRAAMLAYLPLPQLAPFAGQIVTADVWQSEKEDPHEL